MDVNELPVYRLVGCSMSTLVRNAGYVVVRVAPADRQHQRGSAHGPGGTVGGGRCRTTRALLAPISPSSLLAQTCARSALRAFEPGLIQPTFPPIVTIHDKAKNFVTNDTSPILPNG